LIINWGISDEKKDLNFHKKNQFLLQNLCFLVYNI